MIAESFELLWPRNGKEERGEAIQISEALERILLENDLERVTEEQYRRAVKRFSIWLERPAEVSDLSIDNLNGFLKSLQSTLKGTTTRNYRVSITRIWNYLSLVDNLPAYDIRRIRSPKQTPQPVCAWTLEQFACLLEAAKNVEGRIAGLVPAADYLSAWLWVGFDTALRPIDLRLLQWDAVDIARRTIGITQHKTLVPHTASIGEESVCYLRRLIGLDEVSVFPLSKGGMRRWELILYRKARELGFSRIKGQGLGTLRKTHATEVYLVDGEVASAESLGHVGGVRTVRASYIDHRARKQGRLPRRPNGTKQTG